MFRGTGCKTRRRFSMDSIMTAQDTAKLDRALICNGFTPELVKKLIDDRSGILADFRRVLMGYAEITMSSYAIDCDVNPSCPDDWQIVEHKKGEQLNWDSKNASLFLASEQKKRAIKWSTLRKKIEGRPILNACVLDCLLEHPDLIPKEWDSSYFKMAVFWGTIYQDSSGELHVRCLCRDSAGRFSDGFMAYRYKFDCTSPAALYA